MTVQAPTVASEEPDELLEPTESSWKAIVGATLTLVLR